MGESSPIIIENDIFNNENDGVFCQDQCNASLYWNKIHENGGDGVECQYSAPYFEGNIIYKNQEIGLNFFECSTPILINNIIHSHTESVKGLKQPHHGIFADASDLIITNNTIANNFMSGIEGINGSSLKMYNNIIYHNGFFGIHIEEGSTAEIDYNDVYDNNTDYSVPFGFSPGPHDISSNPFFTDPQGGNYHLLRDSPCIDKGYDDAPPISEVYIDFEGDLRKIDGDGNGITTIDIGADEYYDFTIVPSLATTIAGNPVRFTIESGTPPFTWEADGGGLVADLPDGTGAEFTAESAGTYVIQVTDSSQPPHTTYARVIVISDPGRVIIVAGGGDDTVQGLPNTLLDTTIYLTQESIYRTLYYRGFTDDQIMFLSAVNTSWIPSEWTTQSVIDFPPEIDPDYEITEDDVEWAITTWAAGQVGPDVPLFIFFMDHGAINRFLVNEIDGVQHEVSAYTLAGWIDTLQTTTDALVTFIYDACYSGSFLDSLGNPDYERILVTSTKASGTAYFIDDGRVSFTQFFMEGVQAGRTILECYVMTNDALGTLGFGQEPQLEDTTAGELSRSIRIGIGVEGPIGVTLDDFGTEPPLPSPEDDVTVSICIAPGDYAHIISTKIILFPEGYVPPPGDDYETPEVDTLFEGPLDEPVEGCYYTAAIPGSLLSEQGEYKVYIRAMNSTYMSDGGLYSISVANCTDSDGDGYSIEGGLCGPIDCDDTNPSMNPGVDEICDNGLDEDCDGLIDMDDGDCSCHDMDGDGYGAPSNPLCPFPEKDCDDTDPQIHPGASEECDDSKDNDCDGLIDEGCQGCSASIVPVSNSSIAIFFIPAIVFLLGRKLFARQMSP